MSEREFQNVFTNNVNPSQECQTHQRGNDGQKSHEVKDNLQVQENFVGDYKFGRYINFMSDTGFKAVFGDEANKVCIINFLNSILPEDKQVVSLEFMQNEHQLESNPERSFRLDLLCKDEQGRMFIIEMQNYRQKDFLVRAFIYAADIYSRNTRKGSGVFKGIPTYFIGILGTGYSGDIYKEDLKDSDERELPVLSKCAFYDMTSQKEAGLDFFLIFVRLGIFTKSFEECETDQERWFYLFKNLHHLSEMPKGIEGTAFEKFATAAEYSAFNQEKRQEIKSNMMREHDYYAILETYKLDGIEAGRLEGRSEGLVEGEAIGGMKEKTNIAKKLFSMGMPIDSISEATGLSKEEVTKHCCN